MFEQRVRDRRRAADRARRSPPGDRRRAGAPALPGVRRDDVLHPDDAPTRSGRSRSAAAAGAGAARRRVRDDRVRHGEAPRRVAAAAPPLDAGAPGSRARRPAPASPRWTGFTIRRAATDVRLPAADDFLTFIHNAENGVEEKGMFEGRGPLAILLIVLRRRPGAEPDAVRAADDSDQPGDHRRRRAGRLARPRLPARRAPTARRWRSSTACSASIVILTAGTFGTINASPWFNLGIAVLFVVLALAMFDVIDDRLLAVLERLQVGDSSRGTFLRRVRDGRASPRCSPARAWRRSSSRSCSSRATSTRPARGSRWRCRSSSASAWRFRGRSPAPASPRCRSRARGWCASSRCSASSSWRRPLYYGYEAYGLFANRWVDADRGRVERRGEAEGRLARVARRRARRRASASSKPVLIDMWATWCKNCLAMDKTTLEESGRRSGAGGLRQDQVPGGGSRRAAGQGGDAAVQRRRPADLRDHQAAMSARSVVL